MKTDINQFDIDKDFLEFIRMSVSTIQFNIFNEDNELIIEEDLTHDYLMANFKISDKILNFYYKNCRNLIFDEDFERLKTELCYTGHIDQTLSPFSIDIMGAYHLRSDLYWKLNEIVRNSTKVTTMKNKPVKKITDLKLYFIDYKNGFKSGYNTFEEIKIKKYLFDFVNKTDYINKVFEYLTETVPAKCWTQNNGFSINYLHNQREITGGFEDGQRSGYFYKAWTIIFSNHSIFEPLFLDYLKGKKQNLKVGAETEKPKIKTFKEFFNADVSDDVIQKIKDEFKDYYGKKMAYLIYLLNVEFKLITYYLESKTDSRKHFVYSLNKSNPNMQGINECFNYRDYTLENPNWLTHQNFITIKDKLHQIQSKK